MESFVGAVVFHDGKDHLDVSLFKRVMNVGLAGSEHGHNALVLIDGEFSSHRVERGFRAFIVKVITFLPSNDRSCQSAGHPDLDVGVCDADPVRTRGPGSGSNKEIHSSHV